VARAEPFVKYASVILELSIDRALDYGLNEKQAQIIKKGMLVEVPVRGFIRRGYIYAIKDQADFPRILPLSNVLSDMDLITEELFELALWIAKYYYSPLGQVFKSILPGSVRRHVQHKEQLFVMRGKTREQLRGICEELRRSNPSQAAVLDVMLKVTKGMLLTELLEQAGVSRSPVETLEKKGLLLLETIKIDRSPLINEEYFQTKPKVFNSQQQIAFDKISKTIQEGRFEVHLLHGVTGSGKTEVYLQAIAGALALGKGTIMLVPEIALTAQTIERFRSRFSGKIAVLHHRLSDGERFDEWYKIRRGEAQIVIGARSAIFSPVVNLGLIIVDEEHEQSYKQSEECPLYHARDVAVMRGHLSKAAVVLGSATPSLESYFNVQQKKYSLSPLTIRADSAQLPQIKIVDMKKEFEKKKGFTLFSDYLLTAVAKRFEIGEQSILFLNRRGYHTTQLCQDCGYVLKCPHCDVCLTFHFNEQLLACHLCHYTLSPPPRQCPECKSENSLKFKGVGTEQVERALHAVLPGMRTLRMDGDTTRHKGSHERLIREFRTGKADVMIGTQMIAKGLHFPSVTLVGVLNCDSTLNIPDFRASETAFQLITQVSGRAGRGAVPGEVILQTCREDNATIKLASSQDYSRFYEEEIEVRKLFGYPPFTHLVKMTFTGINPEKTFGVAQEFYKRLSQCLSSPFSLNPVGPSGYAKIKDKYRFQFLARGPSIYHLNRQLAHVQQAFPFPSDVYLSIDVDPSSTFF
jgi:primosomal protein N' (replication factor Y)